MFRRGYIENWGRGTIKIAELTEQAGLPKPEFEEIAGANPGLKIVAGMLEVSL